MVCNDIGLESPTHRSFKFWYRDFCSSLRAIAKQSRETVITRSDERRSNLIQNEKDEIATFRCTSLAMTNYGHPELVSVSCGLNPSPAFQAPSPQVARGKIRSVEYMKENNSTDKVHSLFTTHHSLKLAAFTLAEVLITLGIIGVVAAMTMPSLIQHHREKAMVTSLEKFVSTISQAVELYKADNECVDSISTCISYVSKGDENCENFAPIAAKMNVIASIKKADRNSADWLPDKAYNYYGEEQEGIYGGVSKKNVGTCAYLLND